jgi:hypothetical protein
MVEVIQRGEPAIIVCHWTGIYWNGLEIGFEIFREVVKRLHATFDHLHWMKLGEIARYWAAKELTKIEWDAAKHEVAFKAPFACEDFTFSVPTSAGQPRGLTRAASKKALQAGSWCDEGDARLICLKLAKGRSGLAFDL